MVGRHNVQNAVSAVAVANEMGIDDDVLKAGLAGFGGVKRRFTRTGEAGGIHAATGLEHDEFGHPSYEPDVHERMSEKRHRKLEAALSKEEEELITSVARSPG